MMGGGAKFPTGPMPYLLRILRFRGAKYPRIVGMDTKTWGGNISHDTGTIAKDSGTVGAYSISLSRCSDSHGMKWGT